MLSVFDRYIIRIFLLYFVGGLAVFVTIFLALDFMATVPRYEVDVQHFIKYYLFSVPEVARQLFPVACLLGVMFALTSLNKTNELTALFSLGNSLARVSAPLLATVAVLSVIALGVGDQLIPIFSQKKNYVYYVNIKKSPSLYSTVKTNKIWYRSGNILFNLRVLNRNSKKAQGITLYYFDSSWNLVQLVQAKSVNFEKGLWELKDGIVTLFAKESSFPLTKAFDKKLVKMNEDLTDIQKTSHSADQMTMKQLSRFIKKNKDAGLDTLSYEVDYHAKFSFAFAGFILSLIGIPFSVAHQRSGGGLINIGICIAAAFAYWTLYSGFLTLGRQGQLLPIWAAWIPNIVSGFLSFGLLVRLRK